MTDIDLKALLAIAGVVTVFFTALLKGLGYLLHGRAEALKVRNQTLFYLFKIRAAIQTQIDCSSQLYQDAFLEILKEELPSSISRAFPDFPPDETPDPNELLSVNDSIKEKAKSISQSVELRIDQSITEPFAETLIELSSIDPYLAFKLSNNSRLQNFIDASNAFITHITEDNEAEQIGPLKPFVSRVLTEKNNEGMKSLLSQLDRVLLGLAFKCSLSLFLKLLILNLTRKFRHPDLDRAAIRKDVTRILDSVWQELAKPEVAEGFEKENSGATPCPPN